MCNKNLTFDLNLQEIKPRNLTDEEFLFSEDQACYVIAAKEENKELIFELAKKTNIKLNKIANVINDNIIINKEVISYKELKTINDNIFPSKFS